MYGVYVDLFFFFKQKTAYEMRISDWSSDVCSSDLNALDSLLRQFNLGGQPVPVATAPAARSSHAKASAAAAPQARPAAARPAASPARVAEASAIGRASWRERVCQYVLISVVAGSFKKKNHLLKTLLHI